MTTITYKGEEYALRFGWRAQYYYEAMQEASGEKPRPFDAGRVWDQHRMLFCALRASNGEKWAEDFDTFQSEMEVHPASAVSWVRSLLEEMAAWGEGVTTGRTAGGKKKAAAR